MGAVHTLPSSSRRESSSTPSDSNGSCYHLPRCYSNPFSFSTINRIPFKRRYYQLFQLFTNFPGDYLYNLLCIPISNFQVGITILLFLLDIFTNMPGHDHTLTRRMIGGDLNTEEAVWLWACPIVDEGLDIWQHLNE